MKVFTLRHCGIMMLQRSGDVPLPTLAAPIMSYIGGISHCPFVRDNNDAYIIILLLLLYADLAQLGTIPTTTVSGQ